MTSSKKTKSVDWLQTLDFERAAANVEGDLVGDWSVDPWGWPELKWLLQPAQQKLLAQVAKRKRPGQLSRIDVPKENFGMRPAVVMHVADRLVYQACVDRLSKSLIGGLPKSVFNWRLERERPVSGRYEPSAKEWDAYLDWRAESLARRSRWVLHTDIVSCFARIPMDYIESAIRQAAGSSAISERLILWLAVWARETPKRSGLPQRSRASAVLANACLKPIDDVLARAPAGGRWMDDISAHVRTEAEARSIQLRLNDVAREIGLELNSAKTKVLPTGEAEREIETMELNAIEYALVNEGDSEPLGVRLEETEDAPSTTARTVYNFLATQVIAHKLRPEARRLLALADRAPHGADHLARAVRFLGLAREFEDRFVLLAKSPTATAEWAVGRLLLAFPPDHSAGPQLRKVAVAAMEWPGASLVLRSAAATRLAGWLPKEALDIVRSATDRAQDPLQTRVLALVSIGLGESSARVRSILGRFEELRTTMKLVEDLRFKAPRPHKSYAEADASD